MKTCWRSWFVRWGGAAAKSGRFPGLLRCGPKFAIKDDIPNMLIDDALLPPDCAGQCDLECVLAGDAKPDTS